MRYRGNESDFLLLRSVAVVVIVSVEDKYDERVDWLGVGRIKPLPERC